MTSTPRTEGPIMTSPCPKRGNPRCSSDARQTHTPAGPGPRATEVHLPAPSVRAVPAKAKPDPRDPALTRP